MIFDKVARVGTRHSYSMPVAQSLLSEVRVEYLVSGTVLLRRGSFQESTIYVESGRVVLGIMGVDGVLENQLGVVLGPGWLDATAAILDLPCLIDGLAATDVTVRRVLRSKFRNAVVAGGAGDTALLLDIVRTHRQQTEWAVSRLVKGAEARFVEWLLEHSETSPGGVSLVRLQQPKRLIAAQLGIAPETLSRVLCHLRERSLISGAGKLLQLVDVVGLRALNKP